MHYKINLKKKKNVKSLVKKVHKYYWMFLDCDLG